MKKILSIAIYLFLFVVTTKNNHIQAQESDSLVIKKIFGEALSDSTAYNNIKYLCLKIGGRICGSPQAEAAVKWSKQLMQQMNLDTVYTQKVMVHHWVRGEKETAGMTSKKLGSKNVRICALGESIGTPESGTIANVIEVKDFEQLKKLGEKNIKGKIVFFNRAMDPTDYNTFEAYGGAVNQRSRGAVEAAKYGAIGVIVRSMNLKEDSTVHTGNMHYDTTITKIPAAAISTKDANILSKWLKADSNLVFHFKMNCKMLPETESSNVIGEIRGSQYPKEIIAVGGHLDSWELGQGAQDDGTGVIQSIEVLRLFQKLNIKPKHTIRAVLFMDEETDQRGGRKYAEIVKEKKEKHIAAIETDEGGFTPFGFSIESSADTFALICKWKKLFLPYGLYKFEKGGSGVDVGFLNSFGIPCMELSTDSQRYFEYHHSEADTFDKVVKREMQLGSAAIASLVYLLDMHEIK